MKCDRCHNEIKFYSMLSVFNNRDILCDDCVEEEMHHPDYQYAKDKEVEAIKNGNYNFHGVGWPGRNKRVKK